MSPLLKELLKLGPAEELIFRMDRLGLVMHRRLNGDKIKAAEMIISGRELNVARDAEGLVADLLQMLGWRVNERPS